MNKQLVVILLVALCVALVGAKEVNVYMHDSLTESKANHGSKASIMHRFEDTLTTRQMLDEYCADMGYDKILCDAMTLTGRLGMSYKMDKPLSEQGVKDYRTEVWIKFPKNFFEDLYAQSVKGNQ